MRFAGDAELRRSTVFLRRLFFSGLLAVLVMALVWIVQPRPAILAEESDQPNVEFFDSGSFDRKLSNALNADPPTVTVTFPAPITVNGIPERLDKWLAMVEKYGGTVELKPEDDGTRGLISEIISLIVGIYEAIKEKMIYEPVGDYNATVFYKKGEGTITRVVFDRKL